MQRKTSPLFQSKVTKTQEAQIFFMIFMLQYSFLAIFKEHLKKPTQESECVLLELVKEPVIKELKQSLRIFLKQNFCQLERQSSGAVPQKGALLQAQIFISQRLLLQLIKEGSLKTENLTIYSYARMTYSRIKIKFQALSLYQSFTRYIVSELLRIQKKTWF